MIKTFEKIIKCLIIVPFAIILAPIIALGYMCLIGLGSAMGLKSSRKSRIRPWRHI